MNEAAVVLRFAAAIATIALVLWGIAVVARLARGRLGLNGGDGMLTVRSTVPLAHGTTLHVVCAGSTLLVVGSASGGVSLIATLKEPASEGP